jgi:hypothetical protein
VPRRRGALIQRRRGSWPCPSRCSPPEQIRRLAAARRMRAGPIACCCCRGTVWRNESVLGPSSAALTRPFSPLARLSFGAARRPWTSGRPRKDPGVIIPSATGSFDPERTPNTALAYSRGDACPAPSPRLADDRAADWDVGLLPVPVTARDGRGAGGGMIELA